MPIQTVFLDAGGVLVNPNWQRVSDTLQRYGVVAPSAMLAAAEPHAKKRLAGIALSDATAAALAELHTYHQTYNLWETVPDEVIPALAALRQRFRLVVLSNANGTLHRAFERLGLTSSFDVIFDSHNEGVEKPDPRFFQIALERSGAAAASTLHVGDLYHVDVAGARAAGLTPALLDVGGLYPDCDCLRVRSLTELVERLS